MFGCAGVLAAVCGLFRVAERRGRAWGLLSSFGAWTPHRGAVSRCRARDLEHRLHSHGARAELVRRMWDCPKPGIEFVSPTLVGRFLTTRPPRKSPFLKSVLNLLQIVSVLGFGFFGH